MNCASAYRQKNKDKLINSRAPPSTPNYELKSREMSKIVVMSGTATRKPLEDIRRKTPGETAILFDHKKNFREDVSKLRTPFYKTRQKAVQAEEKLMNKSCEVLFECIRPYKDVMKNTKIQVVESSKTIKRPHDRGIIYETATRKVEFFTFSEERQPPRFFDEGASFFDVFNEDDPGEPKTHALETIDSKTDSNVVGAVSSEDFIKNAFSPKPGSLF